MTSSCYPYRNSHCNDRVIFIHVIGIHMHKKTVFFYWSRVLVSSLILNTQLFLKLVIINVHMLCTAQLGGPVLKALGRVQKTPFQLADKSPMITDQHTAGGSVSQLSQLAKLSPWITLSIKDITTSFWHYNKLFCFLSNQIMGLYHFSNPIE